MAIKAFKPKLIDEEDYLFWFMGNYETIKWEHDHSKYKDDVKIEAYARKIYYDRFVKGAR